MAEVARQLIYSQISCYSVFLQRWFYIAWNFTHSYAMHWFHKWNISLHVFIIKRMTVLVQICQDFGNVLLNCLIGCCFAKDHIFQMAFSTAFHLLIASVCILIIFKVINISTVVHVNVLQGREDDSKSHWKHCCLNFFLM